MRRKVFFRVDGGIETGLGHIVRCCALADMLKEYFDCHFFVRAPSAALKEQILQFAKTIEELPDDVSYSIEVNRWIQFLSGEEIVVLDGYKFETEYQQKIKDKGCKLVCIDDIYKTRFVSDVVINHAPGISINAYKIEPFTQTLLGTDYLLLRRPFLDAAGEKREINAINSFFICFGGSDFSDLTGKILDAAIIADRFRNIHLVIGNAYQHTAVLSKKISTYRERGNCQLYLHHDLSAIQMVEIMTNCEMGICPASSILFEACAIGMGLISGFYVNNQQHIFEHLNQAGIFTGLGDFNSMDVSAIAEKIKELNPELLNQQINLQKKLVDGQSFKRLRKLFHKLDMEFLIEGRNVEAADIKLLYQWANDPETRANAINTDPILWEDHVRWFNKKIREENAYAFVFKQTDSKKDVGLVRFDYQEEDWYLISYLVDRESRGKGWGEIILKQGIIALMEAIGKRPRLKAVVKEGNIPSARVFVNLGFSDKPSILINDIRYKVYEKE